MSQMATNSVIQGYEKGKYLLMFRKLVRKVILKKFWQGIFDANLDRDKVRTTTIFRRIGHKDILFRSEQRILAIPPKERDEIQRKIAELIVTRLHCMKSFEPDLRRKLTSHLRYVQYCKGRTVIKERYESNVLYFILSGEITVSKNKWNVTSRQDVTISILGPGDIFGQLGLITEELRGNTYETASKKLLWVARMFIRKAFKELRDIPTFPHSTSTNIAACELLYLLKEDFDCVLKPKLKDQLSDIRTALWRFELYFKNWTDAQLDECTILAKLVNYKPQDVVYSEDRGLLNYVFFLLDGECEIIQQLKILKFPKGKFKLEPIPERNPSLPQSKRGSWNTSTLNNPQLLHRFVTVGEYSIGAIFGLGEELQDRIILAKSDVQALLLPRYWLFQKEQNLGNIWNRTKMFLDSNIPSREGLFKEFLQNRQWKSYKERVIKETPKRDVHKTTNAQVPIICRIEHGQ